MSTTTFSSAEQRAQDQRTLRKEAKRNAWAYLFVSPFYLLYAVFGLFPLLYGVWLSFHQWDGISPMQWVGLNNYIKLFTADEVWWKAIYNTVWLFFGATTPQLLLALVLAFIINSGYIRFKDFFRAAYFMPFVASAVAVGILFTSLFGKQYGMFNYFLSLFGVPGVDWLGSADWLKPSIAAVTVWQWTGYSMIIFLAGLQSINPELYEAARVDGAETRDIFFRITMPLMSGVILFQVVTSIIGAMQNFDIPVMLAGGTQSSAPGGTDRAGLTAMMQLYWSAFKYNTGSKSGFGYASAMSFILFFIIVIFSYTYNRWRGQNPTED
ncbi:MAG: sugar ABC transporter permease [Chloroflexi bacterium]|nr:sugar ABC transporter permease [Chloroflexota bacterium]